MDSEESRPGSSASNSNSSSSSSDENSRPSSPQPDGEVAVAISPLPRIAGSPVSNSGRRSRPRSRSTIGEEDRRNKSNSNSISSSSSDEPENKSKSPLSHSRKASSERSSSSDAGSPVDKRAAANSRNGSVSPVKSAVSSRRSSISSNGSDGGSSAGKRRAECEMNISNDLSDVSDLESEKHVSSFNSKQSLDDEEGTNNSSVVVAQAPVDAAADNDDADAAVITDLRQKLDQKKSQQKPKDLNDESDDGAPNKTPNGNKVSIVEALDELVKAHDEDALDFEAEEGECPDVGVKPDESKDSENAGAAAAKAPNKGDKSDGEAEEGEELEEGEVSDEDEKRPEETEPKPVCRFYTRGQCTWGMSCRFLHPGVTDKGNYTMFDLVRPVSVPQTGSTARSSSYAAHGPDYHEFRSERPPLHHRTALHPAASAAYSPGAHHEARTLLPDPVVVESAWERGLRTAKEMMRKANKRKEQDMDFEDKKMNLTLSPDELEKDPYYLKERGSPPAVAAPPYGRHPHGYQEVPPAIYGDRLEERFSRHAPVPPAYDDVDPYGRTTRYRELPPHRMPQYEDERRVRPTREVIVQRVDHVGRSDEWNDPWMRSKSPGARGISRERSGVGGAGGDKRRRDHRSYSSNSSYSSSSSSQSDSSSDTTHSPSPTDHRRRYNNSTHKSSPPLRNRHGAKSARSPSQLPRHSRHSPTIRHSPVSKRRGANLSPSAQDKRGAYSPSNKRKKLSPNSKKAALSDKGKNKRHRLTSSSGSGSSDSSGSESDSDSGSSSSGSSSRSRTRAPQKRARASDKSHNNDKKLTKRADAPKKRSPISIEIKKQNIVGTSALASPTHSVSSEKDAKKSRREELLKQLRAVEDAIAKRRSKLS